MHRNLLLVLMALALATIAIPTASAASVPPVFDLNDIYCNCLPAGSSNGGTVTLSAPASGEVDFAVQLASPLNFHDTTAFDAFAFNFLSTTGLTISNVTVTTQNFKYTTTASGSGSMDGAGHSFNEFIDFTGTAGTGGNTGVTLLQFKVFGTGIGLSNFEVLNGNNNDFAASVSATTVSGCTGVIGGGNGANESTPQASTGNASGVNCSGTVPEPTSVLLLGPALAFVGKFLKRRIEAV